MSASGGNHRWKSSGGTLLAGWAYDYDRIGNKKYQEDLQSATGSELYGHGILDTDVHGRRTAARDKGG